MFSGAVELDAAEAICADDDLPAFEIMLLLTSLVDKSILIRDEAEGRVRYRLLQTIRQFDSRSWRRVPPRC